MLILLLNDYLIKLKNHISLSNYKKKIINKFLFSIFSKYS